MEKGTKFAIISDIHANIYALNAFLTYIEKNLHVDKILNLGDFVHIGPHPKEVVQTILSDKRFINIIGNNEMILLGEKKEEWHPGIEAHRNWTINQLGTELIEEIRLIPMSNEILIGNRKILMIHSYFYDRNNRTIQDNLLLFQGSTIDEFLQEYPKKYNIILVGHSHEQLYLSWKGRKIINPGSISITWKPIVSFCVMELYDDNLDITFKNIPYDVSNLRQDFLEKEVADRKFLMRFFYPFL